ncbi:MAG: hypothetical protein KBA02_00175 [Paludibacteraceae bacterium]|nr:hypothetical protein [Paludibacteraceae bacterium]
MKGKVEFTVGGKQVSVTTEGDDKTLIKDLSFWTQMPDVCGNCGSSNIIINYRCPQDNDYYGLKCMKCGADYNFGQYKAGGFYHKNEWKVWKKD